jgi:hypothetical protein
MAGADRDLGGQREAILAYVWHLGNPAAAVTYRYSVRSADGPDKEAGKPGETRAVDRVSTEPDRLVF